MNNILDNINDNEIDKYVLHFNYYYHILNEEKLNNSQLNKVNRIFNLYMQQNLNSLSINNLYNLLLFINSLHRFNNKDNLNLLNDSNISNIFKFLSNSNIVLTNYEIISELSILLDYLVYKDLNLKKIFYISLINIIYVNFCYLDENIKNKKINFVSKEQLFKDANLNFYDKIVKIIVNKLNKLDIWLYSNEVISIYNILKFINYLKNDTYAILKKSTYYYNILNMETNLWSSSSIILKEVSKLRNKLIDYDNNKILINKFILKYARFINQFLISKNTINIVIDGKNMFYSRNNETHNINVEKLINYDIDINNNNLIIINELKNKKLILDTHKPNYNIFIIFNEAHKSILKGLNLSNIYILYSSNEIDDDIIQLYLFLTYPNTVLVSKDKHSNYINKISKNEYKKGLFDAIKFNFQINL